MHYLRAWHLRTKEQEDGKKPTEKEQDIPWQYNVAVLPLESRSMMAISNSECSLPRTDHNGVGCMLEEEYSR